MRNAVLFGAIPLLSACVLPEPEGRDLDMLVERTASGFEVIVPLCADGGFGAVDIFDAAGEWGNTWSDLPVEVDQLAVVAVDPAALQAGDLRSEYLEPSADSTLVSDDPFTLIVQVVAGTGRAEFDPAGLRNQELGVRMAVSGVERLTPSVGRSPASLLEWCDGES